MQYPRLGETPDHGAIGHRVLGGDLGEERVRNRGPRRTEVDGEQGVPGSGVATGHVIEDDARRGEVSVVVVGDEERGPGYDITVGHLVEQQLGVAAGHLVEQLLGIAVAAVATVGREQCVEVGRTGAVRSGFLRGFGSDRGCRRVWRWSGLLVAAARPCGYRHQ